ncbi:MAG: NAD(P)/FAD-dependent oxidoreductase [Armatimonadota bacterium]
MRPYVIVGNGVAAISAVEAIRSHRDTTPILILTDQECAFYSRPCLYYILLGRIERDDAWGRPESWYSEHAAELRCNTRVTRVMPEEHVVEIEGNARIEYSKLLLALGTRGRLLPWAEQGLGGIVTLNTLLDVTSISDVLSSARKAVVAGGGLTSIELVEVCRHWGLETTFVMRGERFLDRQLTNDEAELVHWRLRDLGVGIRTNEEIAGVQGMLGRVQSATLRNSSEEIACELAGCAVGVVPNKGLVQEAGGETAQGIVTDDHMRTTLPDVWAAGDAVQVRGPGGTPAQSEMLWYAAGDMGRVAGANVAGGDASYRPRVFLNVSEFCGLDFAGVGQIVPGQPDVEEHVVADRDGAGSIRLVTRNGALVGACFLGDVRLADVARGVIGAGARLADLPDSHPLRTLLRRASP